MVKLGSKITTKAGDGLSRGHDVDHNHVMDKIEKLIEASEAIIARERKRIALLRKLRDTKCQLRELGDIRAMEYRPLKTKVVKTDSGVAL